MMPFDDPRRITLHAVTRYVQRILLVSVEGTEEVHETERARLHCRALGRSIADVRAEIMSPALAAAIGMGVNQVFTRRFWAAIQEGKVTTISQPRKRDTEKLKLTSDAENRRILHALQRRSKIERAYRNRA